MLPGRIPVQGLLDFLKSLGAARIAAMCAVTIALVGFFGFLMLRVTAPQMSPLFTDLTLEDSTAIVKELERQGIAYELRDDGAIVLAPKDRVPRLRMTLAEGGLPKGGGVGYEIFDKSDALGATSFVQNINHHARSKASSPAPSAPSTGCRRRACIWCCPSARCSPARRRRPRPRSC
jgi:flagellar M-ring protein FliF